MIAAKMIKKNFATIIRYIIFPALLYLFFWSLFTFPNITLFSTHYYGAFGDTLQNIWNLWWVNKSVSQLHQLPWYTDYLFYPFGTSLLAHTLNPFNGFLGILVSKFLSQIQTYNFIVLFGFVTGGLTGFYLCLYLTRSYWAGILAGWIFTFSQFHFSHALVHLQLVSLEWIPVFLLCWYIYLSKPGLWMAICSALALFAVILCDYYYFFYCVVTAILMTGWYSIRSKSIAPCFSRKHLSSLLIFICCALISSGLLVITLLRRNTIDPFLGSHDPKEFSMDLLSPFIPGGMWRFSFLTYPYWSKLPGNPIEHSVSIGISVMILLIYAWIKRKEIAVLSLRFWFFVTGFFAIMALGPVLQFWGSEASSIKMPYYWISQLLPFLYLSGVPVRMMVMVTLAVSIISAASIQFLMKQSNIGKMVGIVLLGILLFEYWPRRLLTIQPKVPQFVMFLKTLPGSGAVIDTVSNPISALYYQTIHEKPVAYGVLSRYPTSLKTKTQLLGKAVETKNYAELRCRYNFQYIVLNSNASDPLNPFNAIYADNHAMIYDLGSLDRFCPSATHN